MPSESSVPLDISALCRRNAVELSDARWDHDVGGLIDAVQDALFVRLATRLRSGLFVVEDVVHDLLRFLQRPLDLFHLVHVDGFVLQGFHVAHEVVEIVGHIVHLVWRHGHLPLIRVGVDLNGAAAANHLQAV